MIIYLLDPKLTVVHSSLGPPSKINPSFKVCFNSFNKRCQFNFMGISEAVVGPDKLWHYTQVFSNT